MFCPECGADHHAGEREEAAVADRELEIARVNAKRDVEIARITAGQDRDWNETKVEVAAIEAEAGVEAAEAVADALADVVAPPEPEPAPAPEIVVEPEPEPEPEPLDEVMPPPEKSEHKGYGNSAFFGGR